jgi:hypothetical protein
MQELNQNKYFNVVINNNSYYIEESSTKPDCAVKALSKIEKVFKDNLAYDANHPDSFSSLPKERITELLQNKTELIHEGYEKKEWTFLHIIRRLFGQDEQVSELHNRIDQYNLQAGLPIPHDILNTIGNYLNDPDLSALSRINRQGVKDTVPLIVSRANEYGYDGNSVDEARLYLKDLFSEFRYVNKFRDQGRRGLNIQDLPLLDKKNIHETCSRMLKAFQHEEKDFVNIYKYFSKCFEEYPVPPLKDCNGILYSAVHFNRTEAVRFLLSQGVDVNENAGDGQTALMRAASANNIKMIKILLENGADPNIKNDNGYTAYEKAMSWGNFYAAYLLHQAANRSKQI